MPFFAVQFFHNEIQFNIKLPSLKIFIPLTDFISSNGKLLIFSKQDSYSGLHHQKFILENENLFSFSRLNRFLFIGGINDKIWGKQVLNFRVLSRGFPLYGFLPGTIAHVGVPWRSQCLWAIVLFFRFQIRCVYHIQHHGRNMGKRGVVVNLGRET